MGELSPEVAKLLQRARRTASESTYEIAAGAEAIVLAIHALTLQLAENAERTHSVDAHVETGL